MGDKITGEWLESVGFKLNTDDGFRPNYRLATQNPSDLIVWRESESAEWRAFACDRLIHDVVPLRTLYVRADLLGLVAALAGIIRCETMPETPQAILDALEAAQNSNALVMPRSKDPGIRADAIELDWYRHLASKFLPGYELPHVGEPLVGHGLQCLVKKDDGSSSPWGSPRAVRAQLGLPEPERDDEDIRKMLVEAAERIRNTPPIRHCKAVSVITQVEARMLLSTLPAKPIPVVLGQEDDTQPPRVGEAVNFRIDHCNRVLVCDMRLTEPSPPAGVSAEIIGGEIRSIAISPKRRIADRKPTFTSPEAWEAELAAMATRPAHRESGHFRVDSNIACGSIISVSDTAGLTTALATDRLVYQLGTAGEDLKRGQIAFERTPGVWMAITGIPANGCNDVLAANRIAADCAMETRIWAATAAVTAGIPASTPVQRGPGYPTSFTRCLPTDDGCDCAGPEVAKPVTEFVCGRCCLPTKGAPADWMVAGIRSPVDAVPLCGGCVDDLKTKGGA